MQLMFKHPIMKM